MANENVENEEKVEEIPKLYPAKAISDIKNVNNIICNIQKSYASYCKNYFDKLYLYWTSPRALDFYGKSLNTLPTINDKIIEFNDGIIKELVAAFNRVAPSHHEGPISVSPGPYTNLEISKLQEQDPSGKVGMVDDSVENFTKMFLDQIKSLKNGLSSIPNTIYYYDTKGRLANSCDTKVSELKQILDNGYNKISQVLGSDAFEAVQQSKKSVDSALSSMKG